MSLGRSNRRTYKIADDGRDDYESGFTPQTEAQSDSIFNIDINDVYDRIKILENDAKKMKGQWQKIIKKREKYRRKGSGESKELPKYEGGFKERFGRLKGNTDKLKEVLELKSPFTKTQSVLPQQRKRGRPDQSENLVDELLKEQRRLKKKFEEDKQLLIDELTDMTRERDELRDLYQLEKVEKNEALTRLSAYASSKLRDGNPNVTDLSDPNRPTKMAEKMSELYDNQWTEAFDELEKSKEKPNGQEDIIEALLRTFTSCFNECRSLADNDELFKRVQRTVVFPTKTDDKGPEEDVMSKEFKHQVKEVRKLRAPSVLDELTELLQKRVPVPQSDKPMMREYFKACVEICWLSVVQDPPLAIYSKPGPSFNSAIYRDFTQRGPHVQYVVWPALYLHEGGPILVKGVAQGFTSDSSSQTTTPKSPMPKRGTSPASPRKSPRVITRDHTHARDSNNQDSYNRQHSRDTPPRSQTPNANYGQLNKTHDLSKTTYLPPNQHSRTRQDRGSSSSSPQEQRSPPIRYMPHQTSHPEAKDNVTTDPTNSTNV